MRKTKKQLLGLAGLAAVGIMTAVACAMPAPNAAAANEYGYECNDEDDDPSNDCAKSEGGAQVQVVVSEGNPDATTTSPQDGSTQVDPNIEIATNYSQVLRIDYYLMYKNDSGMIRRIDLDSFTPTEESGIHRFNVNVAQYGYGEYTLHTDAQGYNGSVSNDTTRFNYRAIRAEFTSEVAGNGDPILKVTSGPDVDTLIISVYDKAGNPLFVDENGKEIPVEISRDQIEAAANENLVTLPFEKYGAPAGEYTAVVIARNADGDTISLATADVNYKPIAPEVPDAGANTLADLNITHVDYLVTGLIFFGLVAGFALFLVFRKSRR